MNNESKYISIAKNIILKYVPKNDFAVFLFGSRAIGKENRTSDIDVGVLGKNTFPILIKSDLLDELEESIIPYKVDIVDFKNVSEDFKKIALQHIQVWNCPTAIEIN